ncbi:hypothetical protein B4U80_03208 [Leptotrombidium deliense]|uniref:Uncharacterized protein n=1 Tax=Leptotrombidium deliense TaxID=299467 RepID=A0A443SKJ7_9ACAR|nr:hypothetical protein B4U80_03208 [Leptotrombidium deliense]
MCSLSQSWCCLLLKRTQEVLSMERLQLPQLSSCC